MTSRDPEPLIDVSLGTQEEIVALYRETYVRLLQLREEEDAFRRKLADIEKDLKRNREQINALHDAVRAMGYNPGEITGQEDNRFIRKQENAPSVTN